jgi:hypothetical protein
MRFGCVLILLATSLLLGPSGLARDLYVNNESGNDLYDGWEPTVGVGKRGPFRTIGQALRRAQAGDRIHIQNTGIPYRESITLQADRHSGADQEPFMIIGNRAVLDGSMAIAPEVWEHFQGDIYRFRSENKFYKVVYLGAKPAKRSLDEDPQTRVLGLEPLQWTLSDGYVYFRTESGKLPGAYELSHTVLPVGITLYEVRNVIIQDLTIQGFHLDGVNAHDGVQRADLVGLICRGNGRSGISVGGASRVRVEACLVGDNGVAQLRSEGFSHTSVINSDLIDQPHAPALHRDGGDITVQNRVARQLSLEPSARSSLPTAVQRR